MHNKHITVYMLQNELHGPALHGTTDVTSMLQIIHSLLYFHFLSL